MHLPHAHADCSEYSHESSARQCGRIAHESTCRPNGTWCTWCRPCPCTGCCAPVACSSSSAATATAHQCRVRRVALTLGRRRHMGWVPGARHRAPAAFVRAQSLPAARARARVCAPSAFCLPSDFVQCKSWPWAPSAVTSFPNHEIFKCVRKGTQIQAWAVTKTPCVPKLGGGRSITLLYSEEMLGRCR